MKIETLNKARELQDEIKELERYRRFLLDKEDSHLVHFNIVQHYGANSNSIKINRNHNDRLFEIINSIITELENELESL